MDSRCFESLLVGRPHSPRPAARFRAHVPYVSAKSRRRATYRFVKPQLIWSQWVFFASPRYRTLAQPKIRLITKNACSTFARTFDFVRFRSRSSSLSGRACCLSSSGH